MKPHIHSPRRRLAKNTPLFTASCLGFLAICLSADRVNAEEALRPLMIQTDQILLSSEFDEAGPLDKSTWTARQKTQWETRDGVLHGEPSTKEYQESRKDHRGFEPRVSTKKELVPADFAVAFSFRLNSGDQSKLGAFFELGHHIARVSMQAETTVMLTDHESVTLDEAPDFHVETGKWYHVLAEVKGSEFVVQFQDGPTLYGKNDTVAEAKDGFGLCGLKLGTMDVDGVTIWSAKAESQPGWEAARANLAKAAQ